jgi:hypothetical protein
MAGESKKDLILKRNGALKSERSSWTSHWGELSQFLLPRNGRFFVSDRNKGMKRHNVLYNGTATYAVRVLSAGMLAGASSPARPWFKLATPDPDLNKFHAVQVWLDTVSQVMMRVFSKSNTYRTLQGIYQEAACFGTAATIMLPSFENVVHHYPVTCGEYCIGQNYEGGVNALYREFQRTVGEVVNEFGLNAVSKAIRRLYENGDYDQWVTIVHAIDERPYGDRENDKQDGKNKRWRSCYVEVGGEGDSILRESGFDYFPVMAPRWDVAGGDIYGNSPGMDALGDVKGLQLKEMRLAQAIDLQTKPPVQAPTSMMGREVEQGPGGVNYVDQNSPSGGIRTAFEVALDLSHLSADIQRTEGRINRAFYVDLFLMLANASDTTQRTAAEIAARHEEKLVQLGPVLSRLHNELLEPLVSHTFEELAKVPGALPPPPQELQGMELDVEFVSMLSQAQRAVGTNSIDRFVNNMQAIAGTKPEVLDNFNVDKWAENYSNMLGVDRELLVPPEQVKALRDARNRAMAAKEQAALAEQQAKTAQTLGNTPTTQSNALTDILQQFQGMGSAPAGVA